MADIHTSKQHKLYGLLILLLIMQIGLALSLWRTQVKWKNTPPVPSERGVVAFALGDRQLAYRTTGSMLQNLGSSGGRVIPLPDYNFDRLGQWFMLAHALDPVSDFMPLLAAYYYGASPNPEILDPLIDYLEVVGDTPVGQKWRWLAQAVYLARFQKGDLDRALALAEKLASHWREGRPGWMRQMPVFVMSAQGDKEAAYDLMMTILREEGDDMHPNEVNFMVDYICTRVLEPDAAAQHPLCVGSP